MVKMTPMIFTDHDIMIVRVGVPSAARQRDWTIVPRPPGTLAQFTAEATRYLEAGNSGTKDELGKWGDIVEGSAPRGASRDTLGTCGAIGEGGENSTCDVGTPHV